MPDALLSINGRQVGAGHPCFVIAEAGVNHNGSLALAKELIDAAAEAGADAVKFQTFSADRLVSRSAPQADYQKRNMGQTQSQYEMLKALELSDDDHYEIAAHCRQRGTIFLSTPFDEISADLLAEIPVGAYKIPSGEITNLPFLQHVAAKGRPLIVSTGMSNLGEVEAAVNSIERSGNTQYVLLHCVSNYPADPATVNLRAMLTLRSAFGALVGYSDHTEGDAVGQASVAMGACVVEKHFTLDRTMQGPDHAASLEPAELTRFVAGLRVVEAALGTGRKAPVEAEASTAAVARKSLVVSRDLPAGTVLSADCLVAKRPGNGLPPSFRPHLLNRVLRNNVSEGTVLSLEMLG